MTLTQVSSRKSYDGGIVSLVTNRVAKPHRVIGTLVLVENNTPPIDWRGSMFTEYGQMVTLTMSIEIEWTTD